MSSGSDENQAKGSPTDFVKRILSVGVGTLFLTEESLRGMIGELKLPKELISGILESANRSRKEFLQNLSNEVISKVTEKMDPRALIDEILSRNEIEIQMKISFSPKHEASEEKK
ncbi:MAG: hypothetical protein ACK5QT_01710 [Oligoflexia bacterium]|jgi:hypothetical protein